MAGRQTMTEAIAQMETLNAKDEDKMAKQRRKVAQKKLDLEHCEAETEEICRRLRHAITSRNDQIKAWKAM